MEKKLDLSPVVSLRAPTEKDIEYEHYQTWIVRDSMGDFIAMYLYWYHLDEGMEWHKFVLDDKDREEKEQKIKSLTADVSRYRHKYEAIRDENKSSVIDQLKKMRSELDLLLIEHDKSFELKNILDVCHQIRSLLEGKENSV